MHFFNSKRGFSRIIQIHCDTVSLKLAMLERCDLTVGVKRDHGGRAAVRQRINTFHATLLRISRMKRCRSSAFTCIFVMLKISVVTSLSEAQTDHEGDVENADVLKDPTLTISKPEVLAWAYPQEDPMEFIKYQPQETSKTEPPAPRPKRSLKGVNALSVWDATLDEEEYQCREKCSSRYLNIQEAFENDVCVTGLFKDQDQLTQDSCVTGVDAGLFSGCIAWCNPELTATNTTFRFDRVFRLADKVSSIRSRMRQTCKRVQGGSRIVIQRWEDRIKKQPLQTEACTSGFKSAFASLVLTEQRLLGLDKLVLPVVFWEHPIGGNERRRRFSYWWGGQDTKIRAKEECSHFYPDAHER